MLGVLGIAAQLAIIAHAPDTVALCDAVEVSVAVSARGSNIPRLITPSFAPFDVLRSSSPHVEYSRSRGSVMAEYRYTITTDRIGRFTIPPFEARAGRGDERIRSRPLVVTVRPMRGRGALAVVTRARIDTSTEVSLTSAEVAETVFVGQQATYEVAVFLNQSVRERLRRNPTFYPPEMQAMLAYDLPAPSAASRKRLGSQCFDALVYRRALFPLVPGRLVIPPAQLVYSTGLSSTSLFSREESHELQTDSVTIVALEPPRAGRPAEYAGAVGDFRLEARLDSTTRVGDPLLYTVRIEGSGNVKLFPRPTLDIPWAGLVPGDERVLIDSANPRISGVKEFDWVLTPRVAGEFDVPPVRYGYFDPARQRYEVGVARGSRIRVGPGALANADTGQTEGPLPIRIRYTGATWPPLQSLPAFWLVMALAPVPAIVARMRRRVARQPRAVKRDPTRALARIPSDDPVTLRRHYVTALAQRLGCSAEDFTHPGALARALRRAGVGDGTATLAEALLRELDEAAYAGDTRIPTDAASSAVAIVRAVDAEALARTELPFWIPAVLLACALGVVGSALAADSAESHFVRGVSAYLRQDYSTAREAFAAAIPAAPRAADAWANYGTASWALADTATAVFGWRQALVLQPSALDLHQRMELVRSATTTSPGWVPALPRNTTVWMFVVLWLAAWTFAWIARRPHPWAGRLPMPLAVCALIIGLAAIELETRISGTQLAVVRRGSALTSDPAIGMDRGPNVGTGEIVRIAGRRGTWTRVEAAGDRDGWIASPQLLPLDERRPPRD